MSVMKVTKRWCSNCEGEGYLVDVVKHGGESEAGLPASVAKEIRTSTDDGDEPDDYAIAKASEPRPCGVCGGPGFFFYIQDDDRYGESIKLNDLPATFELVDVSGPPGWHERHQGQSAYFIYKGRH